jgi:hypothetical protein
MRAFLLWFLTYGPVRLKFLLVLSILFCYATLSLFYAWSIATAVPKLLYFQSPLKRLVGGLKGRISSRSHDISKFFKNRFFIPPPKVSWNPKYLFPRYLYVKQLLTRLSFWHLLSIVASIDWCLIICLPQALPCYGNVLFSSAICILIFVLSIFRMMGNWEFSITRLRRTEK